MDRKNYPIGMFDSGSGGLTVMREIIKVLPNEELIYFADTARLPYGSKSRETIIRYSIENAIFLLEHAIKILVVPCNTASAYALDKLRNIFNIPVIGVIEPGAEKAVEVTRHGRIAVLGTKGTIQSGAYQKAIHHLMPKANVLSIPCPLFVPFVEEKFIQHPAARLIVKEYLKPLKEHKTDTILLGCTHYPLLRHLIEEEIDSDVVIVDSASTCTEKVRQILKERDLATKKNVPPTHKYYASDDPEKFKILGAEILGLPIENVSFPSFHHL